MFVQAVVMGVGSFYIAGARINVAHATLMVGLLGFGDVTFLSLGCNGGWSDSLVGAVLG